MDRQDRNAVSHAGEEDRDEDVALGALKLEADQGAEVFGDGDMVLAEEIDHGLSCGPLREQLGAAPWPPTESCRTEGEGREELLDPVAGLRRDAGDGVGV